MSTKAKRREIKLAESVGAVKKQYDNEVVDLQQRAAVLRERVRANTQSMKELLELLPKAQYILSDSNDLILKNIEEAGQGSDTNPVVTERGGLEAMHKTVLENFDAAVQRMQSEILQLLYEWDAMFVALDTKFKLYDKKRATYGHYGRKMQRLAAARKKRKEKGLAETVKNAEQWGRNKDKFKDARLAHDGHKADFIKVSKSLLATQEPRSNLLMRAVLEIQSSLFKGLVQDQSALGATMDQLEQFISTQRRELRNELDILASVDRDTEVDANDMMMQMLLHILKVFFRDVGTAVTESELQGHADKVLEDAEPFFQKMRLRHEGDETALEALDTLIAAWSDLTASSQSAPSVSGQYFSGDRTKCLEGHHLGPFVTDASDYSCDVCGRRQQLGARMHSCRPCNFDVCQPCFSSSHKSNHFGARSPSGKSSSIHSADADWGGGGGGGSLGHIAKDKTEEVASNSPTPDDWFSPRDSSPAPAPAPGLGTGGADNLDLFGLFDAPVSAPTPAPAPSTGGTSNSVFGAFDSQPSPSTQSAFPVVVPAPAPAPAPVAAAAQPERRKGPYIWDYTHSLWRHRSNGTFYNEKTKLYTRNPGPGATWLRLFKGKLVPVNRQSPTQQQAPPPSRRQRASPVPTQSPVPAPADPFAGLEPVAAPPAPALAPAPAPAPAPVPETVASTNAGGGNDGSDSDSSEAPPPLPSRPSRRRAPKPPAEPGKLDPTRGDHIKIIEYLGKKQ